MITQWQNEEIEKILLQLDEQNLPFQHYQIANIGRGMQILGQGSTGLVCVATDRRNLSKEYAIKIIGFGNKRITSEALNKEIALQKQLSEAEASVVTIYDATELVLNLDDQNEILTVATNNSGLPKRGHTLILQFIVMELIAPVLYKNDLRHPRLLPRQLELGEEKEILKLAYHVAQALQRAHTIGILHRDVKLENVFYDAEKQQYKLGDFGIARKTSTGFASTIAFTNGYGAPEVVVTRDDQYDATADIYSFGMMIYLLLNNLKFPDSTHYNANLELQYRSGYVPPAPAHGSENLKQIVLKMCAYSPEDRYQSMSDVLHALEQLFYGGYSQASRHLSIAAYILGTYFICIGAFLCKTTWLHESSITFYILDITFYLWCMFKGAVEIKGRGTYLLTGVTFLFGMIPLVMHFSWLKLITLILCCIPNALSLPIAFAWMTWVFAEKLSTFLDLTTYARYAWLSIATLVLGVVLLAHFSYFHTFNRPVTESQDATFKLGGLTLWILPILAGTLLILVDTSVGMRETVANYLPVAVKQTLFQIPNLKNAGIAILVFTVLWICRSAWQIYRNRQSYSS